MYHCKLNFYLAGRDQALWDTIRALPPLEGFSHSFLASDEPQEALAVQADVILADFRCMRSEEHTSELQSHLT